MSRASLSIPGLLHVAPTGDNELAVLHVGPATGWVALKGLHTWSREISVVAKSDLGAALRRELGVVLPEDVPEAAKLANARRAALACDLVAVESRLVDPLAAKGVRVHTVGSDRVTGGFYYFAKGGKAAPVRVQGNLVEMVAPALSKASDNNATLEAYLDGLIGRVLAELSGGKLSEAEIELADALPALGEPAPEAAAKMQTLEGLLVLAAARAAKYEERANEVVEALRQAVQQGKDAVKLPLFGDAVRMVQPAMDIEYADGDSGAPRQLKLPERIRWHVEGLASESIMPPAPFVQPDGAASAAQKAAAEKAAAEKAAAEKAAAEKAAAEKAAAEKAAAERAAAEKAAAEKAAAERAAAEKKAADERAAAAKAAAEKKAAEERAAAERAAAEKKATEERAARAAAEKKAAEEKAAAEKAAAEKKAAEEKAAAENKAAEEKAAAEKAAADKKAAEEKAAAEKAAAEKKAADEKAAAEKKAADEKAAKEKAAKDKAERERAEKEKAAKEKAAAKKAPAEKEKAKKGAAKQPAKQAEPRAAARAKQDDQKPLPPWIWVALLLAAVAATYYLAFVRPH